ncbi:hypothetical protein [Candidatus Parabeggiatoa sp. HSG14]|uniref:hypothetical protein n=1 Tax=Candidatus Parabeggiatoa sp. HSG14 TaxID=3055593 RepID=UPI0025A8BBBF|nr:hypothetical protein [Thiotrichales bacterium HSG14]
MKSVILILLLTVGLLIDQTIEFWGQTITNIVIWLFFLGLLKTEKRTTQIGLILCVIYATAGEVFLSLIWGLYEYRLYNVPLFVPPGHALLFTVGILLAPKMPSWIIWVVPTVVAPYMVFATFNGFDTMGGVLFFLFLICLLFGKEKKLYATMFVFSLILEIYGTWLGNWTWVYEIPWVGLTSTNPPASAGTFYCLLDLLVVLTVKQIYKKGKNINF